MLRGHTGTVAALAFSRDGRRLVSASYDVLPYQGDGTVRFWEAAPRATLPVLAGHTSYVYPVAYSPEGRWIASSSWDHTVRLWDAATGEVCAMLLHPNAGIVRALAFSPDGAQLSSRGAPGEDLVVWDLSTGRIQARVPSASAVQSVAVSPDGPESPPATTKRMPMDLLFPMSRPVGNSVPGQGSLSPSAPTANGSRARMPAS